MLVSINISDPLTNHFIVRFVAWHIFYEQWLYLNLKIISTVIGDEYYTNHLQRVLYRYSGFEKCLLIDRAATNGFLQ